MKSSASQGAQLVQLHGQLGEKCCSGRVNILAAMGLRTAFQWPFPGAYCFQIGARESCNLRCDMVCCMLVWAMGLCSVSSQSVPASASPASCQRCAQTGSVQLLSFWDCQQCQVGQRKGCSCNFWEVMQQLSCIIQEVKIWTTTPMRNIH